jgi:hypothetical protein
MFVGVKHERSAAPQTGAYVLAGCRANGNSRAVGASDNVTGHSSQQITFDHFIVDDPFGFAIQRVP